MKNIEPTQIQQIKILAKTLGMSDEEYRGMLKEAYGVSSCTLLLFDQADALISKLRALANADRTPDAHGWGKNRYENLRGRSSSFANPAQLRLIEVLWKTVTHTHDPRARAKALDTFLRNRFHILGIMSVQADEVQKVVKTLEAMQEQALKAAKDQLERRTA